MLVQVQLQPLQIALLGGLDHALQPDVGGQGLQRLGIGPELLGGVLAELEEGAVERLQIAGPPVQQGAGALPLTVNGGIVQKAPEHQPGQGLVPAVEGHQHLADPQMTAVGLKASV